METLERKIQAFISVSSGSGSGSGCGYGYGDGSGYGSGDGDGCGYGSGDGDGSGYGDGDGSGSGYGCGDGCGYGYGYGYGCGLKSYKGQAVYIIDEIQTLIYNIHGNVAVAEVLNSDLTTTPCYVVRYENVFAHGDTVHQALRDAQNKSFRDLPEEKRISLFVEQYPNPDAPIPATELFVWHNRLTGSCEMGRRHFASDHGIDIDTAQFTVREFIKLTQGAYGGETVKKLKEAYGIDRKE